MIIHNFDDFCVRTRPAEAHSELIVHSNAVLITPVTFKSFQPITGWNAQVAESARQVKLLQLPACHGCDIDEARDALTIE